MAGAKRRQLGGRRRVVILNFGFWILNWEEGEEVAFCCDLRFVIRYLLSLPLWLFRTWSGTLQGRTGTRCPSYEEEVPRRMRGTAGGTPALPFEEVASSLSLLTNHQ